MRLTILSLVALFLIQSTEAQTVSHDKFDQILQKYVSADGVVDYSGLSQDQSPLDDYVSEMGELDVTKWNRDQQMAYWINLYNAATLKLILDNYPLKSITNLDNGKVWDRKWIKTKQGIISLNNIENDIIRKQFDDARIHAAVNCAAKSCPPLMNKAFTASSLDNQLDTRMSAWINNNTLNALSANEVKLSEIFNWYSEDFGSDLVGYLNKYASITISQDAKVSYLPYDWTLNGK